VQFSFLLADGTSSATSVLRQVRPELHNSPLVLSLSRVPERLSPKAAPYLPSYGLALVKTALSVGEFVDLPEIRRVMRVNIGPDTERQWSPR